MRSMSLCTPAAALALAALSFGLGACAGSKAASNPCLDKCTAHSQTSLERSTCELECKQTVAAPTATPAPSPAPAPVVDPGLPQPAQPTATGPRQYAGDTGPRQAPAGTAPAARPTPTAVTPAAPTGPSMAELQAQRGRCESTCDAENASNSDRATCRLQCAQITDRPGNTNIPASTGSSNSAGTPVYVRPPGTTQGGATQPAPADRASIAACEATCNSASTPATDRATCRLNCNAVGTVGPTPSSYYVLQGAPPAGTSRADVIRSSGGVVQPQTPDTQKTAQCAAQAQQCAGTCSTQLDPCNRGCNEGKLSATDRATCTLTCESNVDGCRDDCRIKEGTCRGPTVRR